MLYRVNIKGKVELVGVGDYYVSSTQKTYLRDNSQNGENSYDIPEEELPCANSESNYRLGDNSEENLLKEGLELSEDSYETSAKSVGALQGNIRINNVNYRWMEVRRGTNRGMLFNPGEHRYSFRPNPHDDRWYNRHQTDWYNAMAREFQRVGNANHWTQDNWGGGQNIRNLRVHNETYMASVF